MTIIEGFYDEVGFSESTCTSVKWNGDSLELFFESGVSLGGSDHPLAESFDFGNPCKIKFEGITSSKLKISHLISKPNNFETIIFEKDDLPPQKKGEVYSEYDVEGMMMGMTPTGWFTWDIIAEKFYFDDLK